MPTFTVPDTRRLILPADLELRDDSDEEFTLIGHAAVWDRLSEDLGGFREKIRRGAFRRALDEQDDVRLLINHDGLPLARTRSGTLELREDPQGLRVYARLAVNEANRALRQSMQRGDVDQMSFAFQLPEDGSGEKWERSGDEVTRTITAVSRLLDVSVVTFPAYPQSAAQMRSVTPVFDGEPEVSEEPGGSEERDTVDTEERVAALREQQARSKRLLTLAQTQAP